MKFPRIKKRYYFIGVGVLLIGGIVFAATRPKKITYETEAVSRGDVTHDVTVTGSIAPFKKIELQPEVSARVTKVYVDAGAQVKAGDPLIDLDARDVNARIASQRAAIDSARARLAELTAGATPQELAQAQAAVDTAQSRLDAAISAKADSQSALDIVRTQTDAQMAGKLDAFVLGYDDALTAAKDSIDRQSDPLFTSDDFLTFSTVNAGAENDAKATRTAARAKLSDLLSLVAAVKAAHTADAAQTSYAAASSDLAAVKTHLEADRTVLNYASGLPSATLAAYQSAVSAGISALDGVIAALSADRTAVDLQSQANASALSGAQSALTAATFAVDTSGKTLAQAKADLTLKKIGNRPETVASQRAEVESQEAVMIGLQTDLSKRRITAPLDGVVTDVAVEIGETVVPGKTAVTVNGKGRFEIVSNVSEVDIARLKVGQPVSITLDAYPSSQKWTGTVASIDPAEKVLEGVIFYETKVAFDQEDDRLRSGMTANLSVETARAAGVLRAPIRALKEQGDKTFVDVLVAGAPVQKEVTVGVESDEYAEIVSGLAEGDLAVTAESGK